MLWTPTQNSNHMSHCLQDIYSSATSVWEVTMNIISLSCIYSGQIMLVVTAPLALVNVPLQLMLQYINWLVFCLVL